MFRERSRNRSAAPGLEDFLKLRRLRRWLVGSGVALLVLLLTLLDRSGVLLFEGSDLKRYDGQSFTVARVIDGDTLDLAVPDPTNEHGSRTTRVRLWGIDTPELGRDGRPSEPFARAATEYARDLADGREVTVRMQAHRPRDNHDRLLAYIELSDGRVLNEELVAEGLARHDPRWPHDDLERYEALQDQARDGKRGLWQ